MRIHQITLGDTLEPLGAKLRRQDETGAWEWVDLTGLTVAFRMVDSNGVTKVNDAAATITDAVNGEVEYNFDSADVDTAGTYYGWFRVTGAGAKVATYPPDGRTFAIVISTAG